MTASPTNPTPEKGAHEEADAPRVYSRRWMEPFFAAYRVLHTVSGACEAVDIHRSTFYEAKQRDEDFAIAWADISEEVVDALEAAAYERAVEGKIEKRYDLKGNLIEERRVYSDTLLIFLLKGKKPEVYRDRIDHRHSGAISNRPKKVDLSRLDLEEAEELKRLLTKTRDPEEVPS